MYMKDSRDGDDACRALNGYARSAATCLRYFSFGSVYMDLCCLAFFELC